MHLSANWKFRDLFKGYGLASPGGGYDWSYCIVGGAFFL